MTGILGRALNRMSQPDDEVETLQEGVAKAGCASIASQRLRDVVMVHGTLRSVTLRPVDGVSWLEAELYDGSASLILIWLGRRRIEGISCGREVTVHGRLGERDGAKIMFNPRYELTA